MVLSKQRDPDRVGQSSPPHLTKINEKMGKNDEMRKISAD